MSDEIKGPVGLNIQSFVQVYGPLAFGIVSLLIIWMTIITPVLDKQSLDFQAQQKLIEQLNETANNQKLIIVDQKQVSESLRQTAIILERTIKTMDDRHALDSNQ